MEEKKLSDEIEDLMIEFDEMGFEPTTLVPNFQEYTRNYKQRLLDLFNRQKAEIERLKDACECFQEIILSMQCRANNGKGVIAIHEIEQKKDGE